MSSTPRTDAASFIVGYGHIGLRVCGTFNMAELEKDLVAAQAQIEALRSRLHEIAEVYTGSEGITPIYASEAYLMRLLKQMYDLAVEAK